MRCAVRLVRVLMGALVLALFVSTVARPLSALAQGTQVADPSGAATGTAKDVAVTSGVCWFDQREGTPPRGVRR